MAAINELNCRLGVRRIMHYIIILLYIIIYYYMLLYVIIYDVSMHL
jgi:hypothetical protein